MACAPKMWSNPRLMANFNSSTIFLIYSFNWSKAYHSPFTVANKLLNCLSSKFEPILANYKITWKMKTKSYSYFCGMINFTKLFIRTLFNINLWECQEQEMENLIWKTECCFIQHTIYQSWILALGSDLIIWCRHFEIWVTKLQRLAETLKIAENEFRL